jgi:hypothetical protein
MRNAGKVREGPVDTAVLCPASPSDDAGAQRKSRRGSFLSAEMSSILEEAFTASPERDTSTGSTKKSAVSRAGALLSSLPQAAEPLPDLLSDALAYAFSEPEADVSPWRVPGQDQGGQPDLPMRMSLDGTGSPRHRRQALLVAAATPRLTAVQMEHKAENEGALQLDGNAAAAAHRDSRVSIHATACGTHGAHLDLEEYSESEPDETPTNGRP